MNNHDAAPKKPYDTVQIFFSSRFPGFPFFAQLTCKGGVLSDNTARRLPYDFPMICIAIAVTPTLARLGVVAADVPTTPSLH